MSAGRLIGILLVLGVLVWLVKSYNVFSPANSGPAAGAPIQKAKDLEKKNQENNMSLSQAAQEANQAGSGGQVSDNMTPDQVRSLLGPPDDTESFTTDLGKAGEKWTYRAAGKTVVFEDGIVVRVE